MIILDLSIFRNTGRRRSEVHDWVREHRAWATVHVGQLQHGYQQAKEQVIVITIMMLNINKPKNRCHDCDIVHLDLIMVLMFDINKPKNRWSWLWYCTSWFDHGFDIGHQQAKEQVIVIMIMIINDIVYLNLILIVILNISIWL